jgi:hypothetical protein
MTSSCKVFNEHGSNKVVIPSEAKDLRVFGAKGAFARAAST